MQQRNKNFMTEQHITSMEILHSSCFYLRKLSVNYVFSYPNTIDCFKFKPFFTRVFFNAFSFACCDKNWLGQGTKKSKPKYLESGRDS